MSQIFKESPDSSSGCCNTNHGGKTVTDIPGWPTVFELNRGESHLLKRCLGGETVEREIRLIEVNENHEPDFWTGAGGSRTLLNAEVSVEVSGVPAKLLCRPYQQPVTVNGLRLYVEATRSWANDVQYAPLQVNSDVRLSAVAEGENWGPASFVFPIGAFRWRANTYNNTWLSLVPYNSLYYHRGDDFGAIPDVLPVIASLDGTLVQTPLPDGDGKSNWLLIQTESGIRLLYAHMNTENINCSMTLGRNIAAGDLLGKTGMTWSGGKTQKSDPHLHFGLIVNDTNISAYPFITEAYFRSYPSDKAITVAGGYRFTVPGMEIEIDGSRSQASPGHQIKELEWRLHDGSSVKESKLKMTFDRPGLYSEELIVRTEDGYEDRDFLQVRVYDKARGREIATGWVYHSPVRGIRPDMPVLFWNRLRKVSQISVDFGDGAPSQAVEDAISHSYAQPGIYTVTFSATGPADEPVTVKMRVVVEPVVFQGNN